MTAKQRIFSAIEIAALFIVLAIILIVIRKDIEHGARNRRLA